MAKLIHYQFTVPLQDLADWSAFKFCWSCKDTTETTGHMLHIDREEERVANWQWSTLVYTQLLWHFSSPQSLDRRVFKFSHSCSDCHPNPKTMVCILLSLRCAAAWACLTASTNHVLDKGSHLATGTMPKIFLSSSQIKSRKAKIGQRSSPVIPNMTWQPTLNWSALDGDAALSTAKSLNDKCVLCS